jgi:hypothetical protein
MGERGETNVTESVYLLWFVKERENRSDVGLLIGVYSSEHDAQLAIERVRDKPGFAIFPKDFKSTATKLGKLVGRTATSKLANHGTFRGRRLGKKEILRREGRSSG